MLAFLNAGALLLFPFFITVDGPMHVLHACVIRAGWWGHRFDTPAVTYLTSWGMLDAGDLVLIPLTWFFGPYLVHALFASFVTLVLGLGLLHYLRAYGRVNTWAFLLLLPFLHSFLLMMGFLPFLLALGVAFACAGAWVRVTRLNTSRMALLLAGVLLCASVHRAGAQMLLGLVLLHEAVLLVSDRGAFRARWSGVPRIVRNALLAAGAISVVFLIVRIVHTGLPFEQAEIRDPIGDLLRMRPLLLVDSQAELPFLLGFGALIIVLFARVQWSRWRAGKRLVPSDALWITGVLCLLLSITLRGHYADLIYLVERSQFIGVLLLCGWCVVAWEPRGAWKVVLAMVLVCQVTRVFFLEHRLRPLGDVYASVENTTAHLPAHEVVLPVMLGDNWLLDHISALMAAEYEGVVYSTYDHLGFAYGIPVDRELLRYSWGVRGNVPWLREHVRQGHAPVIDHVVVIGAGAPKTSIDSAIVRFQQELFAPQWESPFAQVWGRKSSR